MSTYELAVELDEIQANRLTSLLQEREKLVDGMYEKLESHPKEVITHIKLHPFYL